MSKHLMRWNDGEQPLGPHNFVFQTLRAAWDNLPQLLLGMIWLNLCLAPSFVLALLGLGGPATVAGVLLAAPGWVALQYVQGQMVQGKAVPPLDLLRSFRRFWSPSVHLAALAFVLPAVTYLAVVASGSAARAGGDPTVAATDSATIVLVVGTVAGLLVAGLLILYTAPLLVLYKQDLRTLLRNSVVLSARHITNTLGMVALAVLCGFLVARLNSGLLFVLPALYGMFVVNNCRLVLQQEEHPL